MSTPDIVKKLKRELDRGIASEARAVYLLTEVRKLIERDKAIAKQLGVGVGTLYRSAVGCSKIREKVFGTRARVSQG